MRESGSDLRSDLQQAPARRVEHCFGRREPKRVEDLEGGPEELRISGQR